jgi:hypothetical protein
VLEQENEIRLWMQSLQNVNRILKLQDHSVVRPVLPLSSFPIIKEHLNGKLSKICVFEQFCIYFCYCLSTCVFLTSCARFTSARISGSISWISPWSWHTMNVKIRIFSKEFSRSQ